MESDAQLLPVDAPDNTGVGLKAADSDDTVTVILLTMWRVLPTPVICHYTATCIMHNICRLCSLCFSVFLDFVTNMHAGTTNVEVRKFIACKLNISQKKK